MLSIAFLLLNIRIIKWCAFHMMIDALAIDTLLTAGASFAGAACFWYVFCPNRGCCQMRKVRNLLECTQEPDND